jgi:hypothetical protein
MPRSKPSPQAALQSNVADLVTLLAMAAKLKPAEIRKWKRRSSFPGEWQALLMVVRQFAKQA